MKKILLFITALIICLTNEESKAQLANGSIAPDFTFTDIAGHTQHLYAYLDSGITTYINISATWSPSSWAYHNTRYLDSLYNHYGPGAAKELTVLFIEGELTNDSLQLYGISASSFPSGLSLGNFTTNVPYPIIDLKTTTPGAASFVGASGYNAHMFPTIYMICPDRRVTLLGEQNAATLYASRRNCDTASVNTDAELFTSSTINNALASCDSVIPTFRIGNIGTSPLTTATIKYKVDGVLQKTFTWNGNLATYHSAVITGVKVAAASGGNHTVTAYVSNPNSVTDPTTDNDSAVASFVLYPAVGGALVNQDFESAGMPDTWTLDNGGDLYTWENTTDGYLSGAAVRLRCYYIPVGDVDMFTMAPLYFDTITAPGLTFDVSYAPFEITNHDRLEVQASHDCGVTWTTYFSKAGDSLATHVPVTSEYAPASQWDWRNRLVEMHTEQGFPQVLVRFKVTSDYGNDIFIDNINVLESAGIKEVMSGAQFNMFPNPTENNTILNYLLKQNSKLSICLTNVVGEELQKVNLEEKPAGEFSYRLSAEGLSSGIYFVTVQTEQGISSKKLIIDRQ